MTLMFNIAGLLILAGLIGIFLRLGRRPYGTASRSGRPPEGTHAGQPAKRAQ